MSLSSKIKALPRIIRIWKQIFQIYPPGKGAKVFNQIYRSKEHYISGAKISVELPYDERSVVIRGNSTDSIVFHEIFIEKVVEIPFKMNPKFILDCGAYVGYSSVFFAETYPEADVLAVEASNKNYMFLKENVAAFPSISPIYAAIHTSEGFVTMEDPVDEEWAYRIKAKDSSSISDNSIKPNQVRATTIGRIFKESGKQQIDLIKLDIEGSEYDLFKSGDLGWLDHTSALLIECHDNIRPGCSELVEKEMGKRSFLSVKMPQKGNRLYYKSDSEPFC